MLKKVACDLFFILVLLTLVSFMRYFFITITLSFASVPAYSQESIFGTNNFIEYQVGTLPIVISVPHGGDLEPEFIPDRTCNNPVYATDAFTVETAAAIREQLFQTTGCYPHIIICHLARRKLDCNRNLNDGACGNQDAATAWTEFHAFVEMAQTAAANAEQDQLFFVDLHGHGNPIQRIELGYLLYDDELELSDETLNTSLYMGYSSIGDLAANNPNNLSHAQLLRGESAFGTLLANNGYPSVPSQQIPFPGTSSNYFSGGYITANHTCYAPGNTVNGVQMELNYDGIRNSEVNRQAFAEAFTSVIVEFLDTHFDVSWGNCTPVHVTDNNTPETVFCYPNPVVHGDRLYVPLREGTTFSLTDSQGRQLLDRGFLEQSFIDTRAIDPGVYLISFEQPNGARVSQKVLVIN